MPKEIKEFASLQEKKPQISKVSNEELLKLLSGNMYTTKGLEGCTAFEISYAPFSLLVNPLDPVKEVAAFLKVENGTAFSRLRRMEKNGLVVRRWEGNRSWWVSAAAVGIEVPTQLEEASPEEAAPEEIPEG